MTPIAMIHDLRWPDLPKQVQCQAHRCLLDTLGVAAGGLGTDLSRIVRDYATEAFCGTARMLFDGRPASAPGAALAAGMTIDALDGHDGFNPAKGHIGAPLVAGLVGFAQGRRISGSEFLSALVIGYEFGSRASVAQHATVADYHTSGSWGAVTVAAAVARMMELTPDQTCHALGIAEYHGPRSQMMRCIDHPTMLKDGSGWGAMTGVAAAQMAARGFTGAPAVIVEHAPEHWRGLGERWQILEQYFKPYPVCRWAQGPIEGVLALVRTYGVTAHEVDHIEVESFHEAVRLATSLPRNTEQAQYSTSFPCAVALVRGNVEPDDVMGDALGHPEILRLSTSLTMREASEANARFPAERLARVTLKLRDGRSLAGDWMQPRWDRTDPPSDGELRDKFHALADPVLGGNLADAVETAVNRLESGPANDLLKLVCQPVS